MCNFRYIQSGIHPYIETGVLVIKSAEFPLVEVPLSLLQASNLDDFNIGLPEKLIERYATHIIGFPISVFGMSAAIIKDPSYLPQVRF